MAPITQPALPLPATHTCLNSHVASAVLDYVKGLRDGGLSVATSNHYLRAVKSFARWLANNHRTPSDPLKGLSPLNARADLRRERRALTQEESVRLLRAAQLGPMAFRMSGPLRALVYQLALTTGLRANELRSLTWSSFVLDSPAPTVTVKGAY